MRPSHLDTRYKHDLSPRQREVLALIAKGKTNAEIATRLGITLDGAKYHVREILGKLGVDSREEAAAEWRRMRSPGARLGWLRALAAALGGRAAMAIGGAAVAAAGAAIALVLVATHLGGGDGKAPLAAPAGSVTASAVTPVPTPTASPTLTAEVRLCMSADVRLALTLIPDGDVVRIRASAEGTAACTLGGPAWLHIIRPPTDPGPKLPTFANLDRHFKTAIEFPFSGMLAEWRWSNWCGDPATEIWELRAGGNADYALAQTVVDTFPPCVDDAAPTSVEVERLVTGVDGEVFPEPACAVQLPGWLCQFAARVAVVVPRQGGVTDLVRTGRGRSSACEQPPPGFGQFCAAVQPDDGRYALRTDGGTLQWVDQQDLLTQLRGAVTGKSWAAAIGIPAEGAGIPWFTVNFSAGRGQGAFALVFRLAPGYEPPLIGAELASPEGAGQLLAAGRTRSVVGDAEVVPLPPAP